MKLQLTDGTNLTLDDNLSDDEAMQLWYSAEEALKSESSDNLKVNEPVAQETNQPVAEQPEQPSLFDKAKQVGTDIENSPAYQSAKQVATALESSPIGAVRRYAYDQSMALSKGLIGVPEFITGIADIASGGEAGKYLEDKGIDFKAAKEYLTSQQSPEEQSAQKEIQSQDTFGGTLKAAVTNPVVTLNTALESAPASYAGGAIGGAVKGIGMLGKAGTFIAPAAGELVVGAGQQAEGTRQETDNGLLTGKQSALAVAAGAGDAFLAGVGGVVAKKLGIADFDTLSNGTGSIDVANKSVLKQALGGVFTEGVLEELPQSAQEQILQNIALDKPDIMEGVSNAAAIGLVTGGLMGGGYSLVDMAAQNAQRQEQGGNQVEGTPIAESMLQGGLPTSEPAQPQAEAPVSDTLRAYTDIFRDENLNPTPPAEAVDTTAPIVDNNTIATELDKTTTPQEAIDTFTNIVEANNFGHDTTRAQAQNEADIQAATPVVQPPVIEPPAPKPDKLDATQESLDFIGQAVAQGGAELKGGMLYLPTGEKYSLNKAQRDHYTNLVTPIEQASEMPTAEMPTAENKKLYELTREEYAARFPTTKESDYDDTIRNAVTLGDLTQEQADKVLIRTWSGQKEFWAKTRSELEQEKKDSTRSLVKEKAQSKKNPTYNVKWAQKSEDNSRKIAIEQNKKRYDELLAVHKERVQEALDEGKPVPKEVLADYPDLKPSVEVTNQTPVAETPTAETPSYQNMTLDEYKTSHPKPYRVGNQILKTDITKMSDADVLQQFNHEDLKTLATIAGATTSGTKTDLLNKVRTIQQNREMLKDKTSEELQGLSVKQLREMAQPLGVNKSYINKPQLIDSILKWRENSITGSQNKVAEFNQTSDVVKSVQAGNEDINKLNIKRFAGYLLPHVTAKSHPDLYPKVIEAVASNALTPPFNATPKMIENYRNAATRATNPDEAKKNSDIANALENKYQNINYSTGKLEPEAVTEQTPATVQPVAKKKPATNNLNKITGLEPIETAIGKLGGINREMANRAGFSDFKGWYFTKKSSEGFDGMALRLADRGYDVDGENDLIAKLDQSLNAKLFGRGQQVYTFQGLEHQMALEQAEEYKAFEAEQKELAKELSKVASGNPDIIEEIKAAETPEDFDQLLTNIVTLSEDEADDFWNSIGEENADQTTKDASIATIKENAPEILDTYTEQEIRQREEAQKLADKEQAAKDVAAERKRQADQQVNSVVDEMLGTGMTTSKDLFAPERKPKANPSGNTIFTDDAAEKARAILKSKLGQLNSGLDPELINAGITLAGWHIEKGARTFSAYAKAMIDDMGTGVKPYLKSWYLAVKFDPRASGFENMDDVSIVDKADIETITAQPTKETENVPSTDKRVERYISNANAIDERDGQPVYDEADTDARIFGQTSEPVGSRGNIANSDSGDSISTALTGGEQSDNELYIGNETGKLATSSARNLDNRRSGNDSLKGMDVRREGSNPIKQLPSKAIKGATPQRVEIKTADIGNIKQEMPFLDDGQVSDVAFAEKRFEKEKGVLFTNGTGTGKTFTGLGIMRRFVDQGKDNIIVIAPSQNILDSWIKAAKKFFKIDITLLKDKRDAGNGIVGATYANFGDNDVLADRDWDLIVTDEAQYLMQNEQGDVTNALNQLRALTHHNLGFSFWFNSKNRELITELEKVKAPDYIDKFSVWDFVSQSPKFKDASPYSAEVQIAYKDEIANRKQYKDEKYSEYDKKRTQAKLDWDKMEDNTKVVLLSATPFAHESNIDYAEGYLFTYGDQEANGYNSGGAKEKYFMQHLGYRMRYNKLTQPDAKVDRSNMQRQFNETLKKSGAVSARTLNVDYDYDRRFILTESAVGQRIDEALQWLSDNNARDLADILNKRFGGLERRFLLEAIKAKEVVPIIRDYLAAGKKVIVFHDYKVGGVKNPFGAQGMDYTDDAVQQQYRKFQEKFPDLTSGEALAGSMVTPIERFKKEFGDDVMIYNGDSKTRIADVAKFNDDNSGKNLMLLQSASAKEGVSFHDTTGKHQRVLINIGLPTAPTTAIQQEGRIFRVGQKSDAIFRYINTGTNWERWAFASTIAGRASAAENLALGEFARGLRDAFIDAFELSGSYPVGHEGEGKGGKEKDRAAARAVTEMDKARSYYYAQQQKNARTKSAEGTDYFATPEPVGLVMTRLADAKEGEKMLEPSAGHGAIARWFRPDAERTAIEPSAELNSRLALVFQDGDIKRQKFEDLNIINKYDAIVMNPPFGTAGKTAIDHVVKAFSHLREGGRIVALIPEGQAIKRLDEFLYGNDAKGNQINPDAHLIMNINLPDVTFKRAGTSVGTRIVVIEKSSTGNVPQQRNLDLSNIDNIEDLFTRMDNIEVMPRMVTNEQPFGADVETTLNEQAKKGKTAKPKRDTSVTDPDAIVNYTTSKGKELKGKLRSDLTKDQAKEIDKFTWLYTNPANGEKGFFIREQYWNDLPPVAGKERVLESISIEPKKNDLITWSKERVDKLMREYAYTSDDSRTKAFVSYISPEKFLAATTTEESLKRIERETTPLDLKALSNESQPIVLFGELSDNEFKITDHEGRHRMVALRESGIKSVPVVFSFGEGKSLPSIENVNVIGQSLENKEKGKGFKVMSATPVNWDNADELKSKYQAQEGDLLFDLPNKATRLENLTRYPSNYEKEVSEETRINARQRLIKLEKQLEAGKITPEGYRLGVQNVIDTMESARIKQQSKVITSANRRRGADWIVSQMRRGVADKYFEKSEADFAQWLLDQNPHLADNLGFSVTAKNGAGTGGTYNPLSQVIQLFVNNSNAGTAVHEILHHTERMMPEDVRKAIVKAWEKALADEFKNTQDAKLVRALNNMLVASMGNPDAKRTMMADFKDGTLSVEKHYQLYNPSEFWAVNGTRILEQRFEAKNSWAKRAMQWMKEFAQKIKDLLGLKSDNAVLKAFESVANGNGKFVSEGMIQDIVGIPTGGLLADIAQNEENLFNLPAETKFQFIRKWVQDDLLRIRVVLDKIREQGGKVDESNDVVLAMEAAGNIAANQLENLKERFIQPLIDRMAKMNVNKDEIGLLLYAKHAPERNAYIQSINPTFRKLGEGGSGMTDAQSAAIIERYKETMGDKYPEFEKLVDDWQNIQNIVKRILVQSGDISPEQAQAWDDGFDYHVPLKGFEEVDEITGKATKKSSRGNIGQGFSISGKFDRKMLGRQSRANQIVENIVMNLERAVIRSSKMYVQSVLYKLIEDNPDANLWETEVTPMKPIMGKAKAQYVMYFHGSEIGQRDTLRDARRYVEAETERTGQSKREYKIIKVGGEPQVTLMKKPYDQNEEISYWRNGKQVRITVNDPEFVQAFNRLGDENIYSMFKVMGAFNRFLRHAYTILNPVFIIANGVMVDPAVALYTNTARKGFKYASTVLATTPMASLQLAKYMAKGTSGNAQWDNAIKSYLDNGGKSGTAFISSIEQKADELNLAVLKSKMMDTKFYEYPLDKLKLMVVDNKLANLMKYLGDVGETATRLSTFKVAVDKGMSPQEAAKLARNVTINFNRRGIVGREMGAMYLFLNASIQGTENLIDATIHGEHKVQATAILSTYVALGYLIALLGGDDGDDDLIPEEEKNRYISIVLDKETGLRVNWKLAYGLSFFKDVGTAIHRIQAGGDVEKITNKLMSSFFGNFAYVNPMVSGEWDSKDLIAGMIPTFGRIPYSVINNRNQWGKPIYPEDVYNTTVPDSEKEWSTTRGTMYSDFAKWMNKVTGGTKVESGLVDISPETMKYLTNALTGSAGTQVYKFVNSIYTSSMNAEEMGLHNLPVVSGFVKEDTVDAYRRVYNSQRKEAKDIYDKFKKYEKLGDDEATDKFASKHQPTLDFYDETKSIIKEVKDLRDKQDEARVEGDKALVKELEAEEKQLLIEYSYQYNQRQ